MLIKQIKEIEIRNKIPIEIEKTADQIKRIQENWKEYIKENINIIMDFFKTYPLYPAFFHQLYKITVIIRM